MNSPHASPPCRDLSSPCDARNAGSSSRFSSGRKRTLEYTTRRINVNRLAYPHMTHLSFLPNMARNRMPGCPLPSLITQHSWELHAGCAAETGVRLARSQVTVIDRSMIDGCSWYSSSVFNCCWIGHFSPCKHVLRGALGWMTAQS